MTGYYYTMPADVMFDKTISDQSKLVYTLIANFCDRYGVCTVTNKRLGEHLGKSDRSLSRVISELSEAGYIDVKVDVLDANKRTITLTTNLSTPHDKNDVTSRQKCLHNNNIYNNNKYIVEIEEIVKYLNEKTNSKYRTGNENTKRSISGRLNEGFTVEDFKTVIDNQVARWTGTEYEQYLTPNTLFSPSKFEKYLNFANRPKEEKPKIKA
jgi:uncharacterized phage protein (TIGR02220 family)